MRDQKSILLKIRDLFMSELNQKRGLPKNEGKSNDVYENKGQLF
jgi:hypothetical protein